MHDKIKIIFIVPSMRGGGAEKVISNLLKYLNREKFDISLALLQKEGRFLDEIPKEIPVLDLKVRRVRYSIYKIIKLIKLEEPDVVFSTLGHLNLAVSLFIPLIRMMNKKKVVFIGRESNTVSVINKEEKYTKIMNILYKLFYSNYDYIIAQAEYMKEDLIKNYHLNSNKILVIHNPVDIMSIQKQANKVANECFNNSKINMLAVGRLSYQKGYDILMDIMKELDDRFSLTVLGVGPDYDLLRKKINDNKLNKKVYLKGFVENPYVYMKQADVFVLTSRFEGFPNVVLESNACNTPVLAFDCPGGTREIIVDSTNGFLVQCGNKKQFVQKLISSNWKKKNQIKNLDRFKVDKIVKEYESFFLEAVLK